MATVTRTTVWISGQILTAAALNGEFNNSLNALALVNADIASGAAINPSKINATFPASGLLVGTTDSQTVSAKTLTKPIVNASVQGTQAYTPGAGGTATLDLSLANINYITMPAGNITIALTNGTTGQCFIIGITQDSGGSRTVTWFTTIRWAGGTAPTLTTTANKRDTFGFIQTGTGTYDGFVIGQAI